jgi:TM2 domain-containing membrane protein YozV
MANLEPKSSSIVAALLSFCCLPGLGHFIIGQGSKGTYTIGLYLGLIVLTILLSFCMVGIILVPVNLAVWALAGVDAYAVAKALEDGETVDENEYKNEFFFKIMSNLHKDAIFNG